MLQRIFGKKGDFVVRTGYSIAYDHFGAAIVNTFDRSGSYGLSTNVQTPAGTLTVATAPRFVGLTTFPPGLLPPAPAGGFPAIPDSSAFNISWGLDSSLKTPYSHVINFSLGRQITPNTLLEVSYVGRFAHHLLLQDDIAMPLNLREAKSGTDYFSAARQLAQQARTGVDINTITPVPFWENLLGPLAGLSVPGVNGTASATQVVYSLFQNNVNNETFALFQLDLPDSLTAAGLNVPGHSYPSYRFYDDQFSSLYAWRSIGNSSYNGLQVVFRQHLQHGLQADFNYTYAKSIDYASGAERIPTSGGNNYSQVINSWNPAQLLGVSDFDVKHQISSNWVGELPVGKGRRFGKDFGRFSNGILGGWQVTGILRWTSGFPILADNGSNWPTNWDIEGWATQASKVPSGAADRGRNGNAFRNPDAVFKAFRNALPGESGTRNPLRGDGYFGIDLGLGKSFSITEHSTLQFRWETFNITNSVRFDTQTMNNRLDQESSFGNYTQTLTNPRVMQFALRFEY